MYTPRRNDSSIENRARTPVKGLRQKLRVALKGSGVTVKFRTELLRDGSLAVKSVEPITPPFTSFDGHHLRFLRVPS